MHPMGALPQKKFGGKNFSHPLRSGGVVQTIAGNSPWKGVPKTGFKILGLRQKICGVGSKVAQILWFSDFIAHFSKMVRGITNLKMDF